MTVPDSLPISQVLPDLLKALRVSGCAVLVAPPGAGKTTAIAPALLDQDWCSGQVILLSPRRVAARAAAERMAELLGEKPGETAGYLTRLDSKVGPKTRILVMTEAIFVNQIVADPDLPGVSAVLFDEAHERHLDSDLGLALAIESRAVLREDLRICVMSATLDGARFARLLGVDVPVIESRGRAHSLEVKWLGLSSGKSVEEAMTDAVLTAWRAEQGDILAFLPGIREIERVRERLENQLSHTPILPLHGQISPVAQRAAIRRDSKGRRRIVLATSIAETSLTLDGILVVIDSGLARYAEFDRAAGTSHLVTRRASQASATQRAGRAARQGPGIAYRLWEEAGHPGRPEYDPPEILTADLAALVLTLAGWGTDDPASLGWLDPPPEASLASARQRLGALGALDEKGQITNWGKKIASLPLDPVSAAAILFGAEAGRAHDAAQLVVLTQERSLGGRGEDLLERLNRWNSDRGQRADKARKLAYRWAGSAKQIIPTVSDSKPNGLANPAVFLAKSRPDNIARRRDRNGENWVSAGGRGYLLDPASSLANAEWLIIADAQGQAKAARITAAAELAFADIEDHFGYAFEKRSQLRWNSESARVEPRIERRLGAISLASGPDTAPDEDAITALLVEKAVDRLEQILPSSFLARARFAGIAALLPEALADNADQWLVPLLSGRRDMDVDKDRFADAALALLDWKEQQKFDHMAPEEFVSPAGTRHHIDYAGGDAPSVEVRVQALFGLDRHPTIGNISLLLKLTSPAGRPIQSTRDLPGFWRGSWVEVCKEMKGRYPKHRWPEQPWAEIPSLKTAKAFSRHNQ